MKILLTRPLQDSMDLIPKINQLGHEAIINPLLRIKQIIFPITSYYDGYIITSKHALSAIKNKTINLIIAGKNTYELALSLGYENSIYAGKNITELKENIDHDANLLYLSGADVTDNLSEFSNVTRAIVYQAMPILLPSPALLEFINLPQSRVILFFSLRTAKIFVKIINKYRLNAKSHDIIILSLSQKIADYTREQGFISSYAATEPDTESLIKMIDSLK